MPTLCLRFARSFVGVAWRGVAWRSSSVAFLLVPLPPSAFFLIYLFIYLVIYSSGGLFILLPLGFWPQCDGCYSGGLGAGVLVAGLRVGRPVGVLRPLGCIAVAAPWPMGTQPPLATQALNTFKLFIK